MRAMCRPVSRDRRVEFRCRLSALKADVPLSVEEIEIRWRRRADAVVTEVGAERVGGRHVRQLGHRGWSGRSEKRKEKTDASHVTPRNLGSAMVRRLAARLKRDSAGGAGGR